MIFIKRLKYDTKYLKICFYTLFVIISAILFEKVISNMQLIKLAVSGAVSTSGRILAPFVYGLLISFFLNPLVRLMEQHFAALFKTSRKLNRAMCSLFAMVLFIGIIICLIAFVMPEIVDSVYTLLLTLPDTMVRLRVFAEDLIERLHFSTVMTDEFINRMFEPIMASFGSLTTVVTKIVSSTFSVGKVLFNFVIGLIIAFYMLMYKDGFKNYFVKVTYLLFRPETANKLINNASRANHKFEAFVVGKTLDSAIIGTICFLVLSFIIKPRYILLSSVIIGVTNMIPFFGPFIGAVPVVALALFYSFETAIALTVFIFLLQQFDGYILGPKILGDSTGLTPFWVIASILVGSALFGIWGMFLGVPVFAVVKMFLDETVDRKFKEKYGAPKDDSV